MLYMALVNKLYQCRNASHPTSKPKRWENRTCTQPIDLSGPLCYYNFLNVDLAVIYTGRPTDNYM